MSESIFRKQSLDHIQSPDQLEDYIQVSNPRVWTVLAAIIVMLLSFLIWAVFGQIPTIIKANGIAQGGEVVFYLSESDAANLKVGTEVKIDSTALTVSTIDNTPLSKAEIEELYPNDYERHMLNLQDWNIKVTVAAPQITDGFHEVQITAETIRAINFLVN